MHLSFCRHVRQIITREPVGWLAIVTCLCLVLATSCAYIPNLDETRKSYARPPDPGDRIALAYPELAGETVFAWLVEDPTEALTKRLALIEAADRTIDAQYYIWKRDVSGHLVIKSLLQAAERGVKVRVLVDDINMDGLVNRVRAINDHPNIQIRVFNPFSVRLPLDQGLFRLVEFSIDGFRLNHRMHNKVLIADNQLGILGGRNIGNDYFGLDEKLNFYDTDVLVSGPIVGKLSAGFDIYWNSPWARSVEDIVTFNLISPDLESTWARIERSIGTHADVLPEPKSIDWRTAFATATASRVAEHAVLYDEPDVRWFQKPDEMADALIEHAREVKSEVLVATPYLVPTPRLLDTVRDLQARGVKIKVMTNSLSSNDLVIAHASYQKYRKTLLKSGIELFEMRADAALGQAPQVINAEKRGFHSKYIVFDDDLVYIGSLNLDPRSASINTELGVVLRSGDLAGKLRASFEALAGPENAWRVEQDVKGLKWTSAAGVLHRQPAASKRQRFWSWLLSLLPLSNQL